MLTRSERSIKKEKNMKWFLKVIISLIIVTLAVLNYSCEKDGDKSDDYIEYDKAECYYFGDILSTGTPIFIIDMYDAVDENIGIQIQGFTSSSSFANLNVTGSYSIATSGAALTFATGVISDGKPVGTFVYNYNTGKFTLVTGGSFDVIISEGKYIITTNFTGKDSNTGTAVANIKYSFTGALALLDKSSGGSSGSLSFSDIAKSNYSATGTPGFLATSGPSTWSGQITPSSGQDQYYEITGWGGKTSLKVWCDFTDKKIIVDNYSKVAEDGDYEGYFYAIAIDNSAKTYYTIEDDYIVAYNKANRILDFSGTYNGLPVYVGVLAKHKTTGVVGGAFTDMYANAKLTLSQVSQSSAMRSEEFSFSTSISLEEFKDYKMVKKSSMMKPKERISLAKQIIK